MKQTLKWGQERKGSVGGGAVNNMGMYPYEDQRIHPEPLDQGQGAHGITIEITDLGEKLSPASNAS